MEVITAVSADHRLLEKPCDRVNEGADDRDALLEEQLVDAQSADESEFAATFAELRD